jgi:hypothetical protein
MPSKLTAGQQDIIDLRSLPDDHELMIFDFNMLEQQGIIDLSSLPDDHEFMVFDFDTKGLYRNIDVWVEVYQNGEMINRPAGIGVGSNKAEKQNGHLAVIISQEESIYQWTLLLVKNGDVSGHVGTMELPIGSGTARAYDAITESVNIEDGTKIIIYYSLFSKVLHVYDHQSLQERPELLENYPHVFLITCTFTR